MKVVFVSNLITSHLLPFCNSMHKKLGDDFCFIQAKESTEDDPEKLWCLKRNISYVKFYSDDTNGADELIEMCDALICGWIDNFDLIRKRLDEKKLTLRVSERLFKEGRITGASLKDVLKYRREYIKYRNNPYYLLCTGAYVAGDYSLFRGYTDKMYKFGYFPEMRKYHLDKLFAMKDSTGCIEIAYAGRFLKMKHPEYLVWLARDLKRENDRRASKGEPLLPDFHIHMIGDGELEHPLRSMVTEYKLLDKVFFYGYQKSEKVRTLMERCHILVFASDELEGWGSVINEAMNSACAVVTSVDAGAAPYLIKQWENGIVFPNDDYEALKGGVTYLMTHAHEREEMANRAYHTIIDEWNAQNAADTLVYMIDGWMQGLDHPPMEGPLSKAPVVASGNMYSFVEKNGVKKGN